MLPPRDPALGSMGLPIASHTSSREYPAMSTQFYGKAESAANRILELFKSGDVPKALAPIFI